MTAHRPQVPEATLAKLRAICSGLPEVQEQRAWVGTRWCVRGKNFAHVLMLDQGWPPAYAKAAGQAGPACLLTFRLPVAMAQAPRLARPPFFKPVWWPDIAGLRLDHGENPPEWEEVEALLTTSYGQLAPKALAAGLGRSG